MSLKSILASIAPVLASALPGPLGNIARKAIAEALGTNEAASDADIEKALIANNNTEVLERLRAAEQAFNVKMRELDIDVERLATEDRASARTMQVQTKAWIPPVLALTVTAGFFTVSAFLIFRTFPTANTEVLMMMLGQLAAGWVMIMSFYFGSSASSHTKDRAIENLSK